MKTVLQEHLDEKLREHLEAACLTAGAASIILAAIYQLATYRLLSHDTYNLIVTTGLIFSLGFRAALKKFNSVPTPKWRRLHLMTVICNSVFWSLMLLNLTRWPEAPNELYIITYLVFAGLVAAASFSLSISKIDFYSFVIPIMSTQVAAFFFNDYDIMFKLSSSGIVLLFFTFLTNQRFRVERNWLHLRQMNFDMQRIIDAVPGGISVIRSGNDVIANKYVQDREPGKEFREKLAEFMASKANRVQFEAELQNKGAGKTHLVTAVKTLEDETIISTADIHDFKQMQLELNRQRARLEGSARLAAIGAMTGGVAHEINNPVAIISGKAQHLLMKLQRGDVPKDVLIKTFEDINKTSERIAHIVKSLRNFSKDVEGEPTEFVPLKSVADDTLVFCEAKFRNYGVELFYDIPESLTFECHPTQISQVLLSAFNNAFDAVVQCPQKWVRINAETAKDYFLLTITDSRNVSATEINAGLTLAKGIVEAHQGELYFRFDQDKNTQLVIKLPLVQQLKAV